MERMRKPTYPQNTPIHADSEWLASGLRESAAFADDFPGFPGGLLPESRCGFILHNADGEVLMAQDCPEIL